VPLVREGQHSGLRADFARQHAWPVEASATAKLSAPSARTCPAAHPQNPPDNGGNTKITAAMMAINRWANFFDCECISTFREL
jgi:hypothetical protein